MTTIFIQVYIMDILTSMQITLDQNHITLKPYNFVCSPVHKSQFVCFLKGNVFCYCGTITSAQISVE
jgi:hypothetical protein